MSDTPEDENTDTPRTLRFEERYRGKNERKQCHSRAGVMVGYDPWLDARADELEALRCLAYLIRNDGAHPERMTSYLDEVDGVLDRMVDALKLSA